MKSAADFGRSVWTILQKDLLVEWRSREMVSSFSINTVLSSLFSSTTSQYLVIRYSYCWSVGVAIVYKSARIFLH